MPLKAAICDDEPEQAGMLERYIKEWSVSSDIKIETRIFPSAEAFRFVWEEEKDWWLILLDIQMEGEDGVSLAKYLRGEDEKLQILFYNSPARLHRRRIRCISPPLSDKTDTQG